MSIAKTALIRNNQGCIYHLNLSPGELANTILLVGDPERVSLISQHFDRIDVKKHHREFVTHTGWLNKKQLSVIGTGIGISNIDIVINEADALVNIDFNTLTVKPSLTTLQFIRLGTAGAIQPNIPLDCFIMSDYGIGFDGLLNYYDYDYATDENHLLQQVQKHFAHLPTVNNAYVAKSSAELCHLFSTACLSGMALTLNGFYGPQSRALRAPLIRENMVSLAQSFHFQNKKIMNFEMETASIYGLSNLLKHQSCSINAIINNRTTDQMSPNPAKTIEKMIDMVLSRLTTGGIANA